MLASGMAGIAIFLADYARLAEVERARDLAAGGLRWCSAPERAVEGESLFVGRAGMGMAWLGLAAAGGDREALAQAAGIGQRLLQKEPGPVTTPSVRR
jgi:hypothetical protein